MTIDETGVVAHGPRAVQRRKPGMTGRPDSDRLAAEWTDGAGHAPRPRRRGDRIGLLFWRSCAGFRTPGDVT